MHCSELCLSLLHLQISHASILISLQTKCFIATTTGPLSCQVVQLTAALSCSVSIPFEHEYSGKTPLYYIFFQVRIEKPKVPGFQCHWSFLSAPSPSPPTCSQFLLASKRGLYGGRTLWRENAVGIHRAVQLNLLLFCPGGLNSTYVFQNRSWLTR